jgi:hypothetical protein
MEEVNDGDNLPLNVAPLNRSHLLELTDGSDDGTDAQKSIQVDDEEEPEESEESEEAELGQL